MIVTALGLPRRRESVDEHSGHVLIEVQGSSGEGLTDEGDCDEDFSRSAVGPRIGFIDSAGQQDVKRRFEPVEEVRDTDSPT